MDELLNTVVNNLIVSANLNVEAHCRVLLTTPLETFSIGHTIVISRGLIDVLPDEASLALVLADELSHIALGHRTPTQFAFRNQTMLTDAEVLQRLHFERTAAGARSGREEDHRDHARVAVSEDRQCRPVSESSGQPAAASLPRLLAANLGNQVANAEALARLAEFTSSAPELEESELEQIAALPLGSRIKLDPWTRSDHSDQNPAPGAPVAAREDALRDHAVYSLFDSACHNLFQMFARFPAPPSRAGCSRARPW